MFGNYSKLIIYVIETLTVGDVSRTSSQSHTSITYSIKKWWIKNEVLFFVPIDERVIGYPLIHIERFEIYNV